MFEQNQKATLADHIMHAITIAAFGAGFVYAMIGISHI
jgi:hypothetical protein